jgi:1-phosphofructokinase
VDRVIYTVTLNPALDYIITMEEFNLGKLSSAETASVFGGGKGINVSKVLKNLGAETTAMGFLGGFTGEYIKKELSSLGIKEEFIEVEDNTRINLKIKNNEMETEIAGIPPVISKENLNDLLLKIKKINKGDILVLSGSLPKNLESGIYKKIMESLPKDIKVVLDTRGRALEESVEAEPYLIKPNIYELEEFCRKSFETFDDIIDGAFELVRAGAQNVVVSMGRRGSFLIHEGKVYRGNAPDGPFVNSVGAGDSMVAGMVYELSEGKDIISAYKFGIGAGSATAFSKNLCTLCEVEELIKKIKVEEYTID